MLDTASSPCATPRVDDIVQALRHPPCAPRVIPVLKRHLSNLNVPMTEIVELIRLDPGVAARVLQAANSALFSRGERCNSVEIAVGRIGFGHIFDIVANAVAEQVLVRPLVSYHREADDFWQSSVACGVAAEHIAARRDEDVNVAYTLGLLHGVGMVAIDSWAQRNAPTIGFGGKGFPRDCTDSERALLGFSSAEAGAAVLRSWEFPPEMAEPIRWQIAPLEGRTYRRLNCILYAARWLSAKVCPAPWQAKTLPDPDNAFLAPIQLSAALLAKEAGAVARRLEEIHRRLDSEGRS